MPKQVTYRYINYAKDPFLEDIVGLIENDGRTYKQIADDSGVSDSTVRNWCNGKVYMPQRFTTEQVLRGMGKKMVISNVGTKEIGVRFTRRSKAKPKAKGKKK